MNAPSIRRAGPADLLQIGALARSLVVQHHDRDPGRFFLPAGVEEGYVRWFRRELAREHAVLLVAAESEKIVGYCYATVEGRDFNQLLDEHAAIHDLVVAESHRRSGVGKSLLGAMLHTLETEHAAPRTVLYTMVDNHAAQALFRSFGFRATMFEMTRNAPTNER